MDTLPFDLQMRIYKEAVLMELIQRPKKVYRYGMTSFIVDEGFIDQTKYINKSCAKNYYFNNYNLYCVPGRKRPLKFKYHTKDMKIYKNYLYTHYPENVSSKSFGMFALNNTKTRTLKKYLKELCGCNYDFDPNINKYEVIRLLKLF